MLADDLGPSGHSTRTSAPLTPQHLTVDTPCYDVIYTLVVHGKREFIKEALKQNVT